MAFASYCMYVPEGSRWKLREEGRRCGGTIQKKREGWRGGG